jgi:hypothetical protein
MNIPAKIYSNLSTPERIRAAVLASARDDKEELQILKETCPKKAFLMTDPEYTHGVVNLFSLLLGLELDLAFCALDFQMAGTKWDFQESALKAAASIVVALDQLIAEMGLDPQAMAKNAPPRHPFVTATVTMSEGEADPELVEVHLQHMREYLVA